MYISKVIRVVRVNMTGAKQSVKLFTITIAVVHNYKILLNALNTGEKMYTICDCAEASALIKRENRIFLIYIFLIYIITFNTLIAISVINYVLFLFKLSIFSMFSMFLLHEKKIMFRLTKKICYLILHT